MGLLNRKSKIGVEEFCQQFYDSQILHPVSDGKDIGSFVMDNVFKLLTEADQSFASIDKDTLRREMTALYIELFGLVFMHHVKKDEQLLAQAVFTKRYLEQNGQLEIWNIMPEYNKAIAASSTEIVSGVRMKRGWTAGMNSLRFQLFEKWTKAGFDPECVALVSNRLGTEVAWEKGITLEYLTNKLLDKLGRVKNQKSEAFTTLETSILALYVSAKKSIQSVNLQSR